MAKIKLVFEKGGSLVVHPNEQAPETVKHILAALPSENDLIHSRYCGREVCFAINTPSMPPPENQTTLVKKFDVAYWRNWEKPESGLPGSPGAETISFYYGAEQLHFRGTHLWVNVFGQIGAEDEKMLEEIGSRIWQKGFERVYATVIA